MLQETLEREHRLAWRWMLLGGIVSIIFGGMVLAWPQATLLVLAVLIGLQLIFWGVMLIFERALNAEGAGGVILGIIGGVLAVLLGFGVMRAPGVTLAWLVAGLFEMVEAIADSNTPDRGWTIFLGGITALAGVIVISSPFSSIAALTLWAGILMIVMGVVRIVAAFQIRNA